MAKAAKEKAPAPSYWQQTRLPVYSLAFVLPMILFYEIASILVNRQVVAQGHKALYNQSEALIHRLMVRLFLWVGLPGVAVSGLLIAAVLVTWQILSRRPWEVRSGTLCGMLGESVLLGLLPLIVVVVIDLAMPASMDGGSTRLAQSAFFRIVLYFGAGVYEEFVFRLVLVSVFALIVYGVSGMGWRSGAFIGILLSAVLFAGAHHVGELAEEFTWTSFGSRTVSGVFFGLVYYFRGFGIAAGSHALYDVFLMLFVVNSGAV